MQNSEIHFHFLDRRFCYVLGLISYRVQYYRKDCKESNLEALLLLKSNEPH
jgi:hypothetical protein